MPPTLAAAVRHRGYIAAGISRQVQAQFRGSLLGVAWVLLVPAALIAVYTLVFSKVFSQRLPGVDSPFGYGIYLCAGLLPWLFLSDSVTRLAAVFVSQPEVVKKSKLPRICLPLVALGVSGINFLVMVALFLAFLAVAGRFPGVVLLGTLPALAVQVMLAFGVGVFLAVVNVYFRDVGPLLGVIFQFLFWLTPIVYPIAVLPAWAQPIVAFNPVTIIVSHYQSVLTLAHWPSTAAFAQLGAVGLVALAMLALAWRIHRDLGDELADEL